MNKPYQRYLCPISKQIYNDPVVAEDGIIYERQMIESWFKKTNISPMIGKQISKKVYPIVSIKNEVKEYLEKYPKYKEEQFSIKKNFDLKDIKKIFMEKNYEELLNYTNFKLFEILDLNENKVSKKEPKKASINKNILYPIYNDFFSDESSSSEYEPSPEYESEYGSEYESENESEYESEYESEDDKEEKEEEQKDNIFFSLLLQNCNNDIIRYVLENSINKSLKKGYLYYICKYGSVEIITDVLLEEEDNIITTSYKGVKALDLILDRFSTNNDLLITILKKNSYLKEDQEKIFQNCEWAIIKYIIHMKKVNNILNLNKLFMRKDFMTTKKIKYLSKKNLEIFTVNKNGWSCLHYSLLFQNMNIIKKILEIYKKKNYNQITFCNMNIDVEGLNNNKEFKVDYKILINMNTNLNEKDKKDIEIIYNKNFINKKN